MRLRLLVLAFAVMLVAAACGPVDWLMFRFEPDHSGSTPDATISKDAVASGSLVRSWESTPASAGDSPAVANGIVYTTNSGNTNAHLLHALSATGTTNCSGSPKTCSDLWTASLGNGAPKVVIFNPLPAIANGVVYAGSLSGNLYAFDAAGNTNCSGTPKTCAPLWTGITGGTVQSSPVVVNGVVYIGSDDEKLYAFDAAGNTNCSGTPKTCAPLWTAATGGGVQSSPAVAGGVVYVGSVDGKLHAFDAAGNTNCSGSPKTCSPLFTGSTSGNVFSSPAVANGVVYVGSNDDKLYAFDAAGNTNCSGTPKACNPLWTATTGNFVISSPAVANGVVYVGSFDDKLYAFDAAGSAGCSGTPKTCNPLWSATTGGQVFSSPAVANGVVYIGSTDHNLYAFDGAGSRGCSGSPKVCSPLWTVNLGGGVGSPVVEDGVVYAVGATLYGYALEKIPPTTSVVIPSNGATLSGTTLLDASASDDVSVSKVEFHLTGGSYHDTLIGVATPTQYGWIFHWDTTSVPNGAYTLNSVATDPAGNVGHSAGVSITVAN